MKIAGWRHSGFSVHGKVRAQTRKGAERVGEYMIYPLLSLERLFFSEEEGKAGPWITVEASTEYFL